MNDNAFLDEIRADPEDTIARLVYADWLEEQGDSAAELIRVQCELAEMTVDSEARVQLKRRERELLEEYRTRWIEPLEKLNVRGVEIRRGLIEGVRLNADDFIAGAGELLNHLPAMCSVNLRKAKKNIDRLVDVPELAQIRFLSLQLAGLDDAEFKRLLESPHVGELLELNLQANSLTAASARLIARSGKLSKLKSLNLSRNKISRAGLNALGKSKVLVSLKRLECSGCSITAQGWNSLLASDGMPLLEYLDISNNRMTGRLDVHHQQNRPLRTLKMNWNLLTRDSVQALAESTALRGLKTLSLFGELQAVALADILSSPNFSELQNLDLSNTGSMRSAGIWRGESVPNLNQTGCLSALTRLNLEYAALDETLAARLVESGCVASLERLNLSEVPMTNEGYEQLIRQTTRLEFLNVAFTGPHISPEFLTFLSEWHGVRRLRMLVVCDSLLGEPDTVAPLLDIAQESGLRIMSMYVTQNDCEEVRENVRLRLAESFGADYESVISFAGHPAAAAF